MRSEEFLIKMGPIRATVPPELLGRRRSDIRLLSLSSGKGAYSLLNFQDITRLFRPGDLLIFNDSYVIPSRVPGFVNDARTPVYAHFGYAENGPIVEVRNDQGLSGEGMRVDFPDLSWIRLAHQFTPYNRYWTFEPSGNFDLDFLRSSFGEIISYDHMRIRFPVEYYQAELDQHPGSVEYPGASRPFTPEILSELRFRGVKTSTLTIHCNLASLDASEFDGKNELLPEHYRIPAETVDAVEGALAGGGRIIAVGTSATRAIESSFVNDSVRKTRGFTRKMITESTKIHLDGIVTGMHDPTTSHLLMLSSFADLGLIRSAYETAIDHGFLWHEFGDSTLILKD